MTMAVEQAARFLGISRGRVYQLLADGTLPRVRSIGRLRVARADLLTYRTRRDGWLALHGRRLQRQDAARH